MRMFTWGSFAMIENIAQARMLYGNSVRCRILIICKLQRQHIIHLLIGIERVKQFRVGKVRVVLNYIQTIDNRGDIY